MVTKFAGSNAALQLCQIYAMKYDTQPEEAGQKGRKAGFCKGGHEEVGCCSDSRGRNNGCILFENSNESINKEQNGSRRKAYTSKKDNCIGSATGSSDGRCSCRCNLHSAKSNVTIARCISALCCQVETGQVIKLTWAELKHKGGTVLEHKNGAGSSQYEPDKKSQQMPHRNAGQYCRNQQIQ